MTLSDLQQDVLIRLARVLNTNQFALVSGAGGNSNPVVTALQVITDYLVEVSNHLARNFCPIEDIATYTWPAGALLAKYPLFACTILPENVPFSVIDFTFGGQALTYSGRGAMSNWYSPTDPYGNPFYYDNIEGVRLSQAPTNDTAVSANVLVTPQPLSELADTPQFPTDLHYLLSVGACAKLIVQRADSPELAVRGMRFAQEYTEEATAILARIDRQDPDMASALRKAALQTPLIPPGAAPGQ
jgi:hypothetical protein